VTGSLPPFQRLLDEHSSDVLAYLVATVGLQEADDCFQETFIAALRAYPSLKDSGNLRSWLLTIAHNKAMDHHRSRVRQPVPVAAPPERESRDGDGLGADPVWGSVAGLPPKQRAAVALRFACDLPHRDIGVALGCSEAAARRNVHEGIKQLREEMA
jgi:DNA-directed RNA polymerase specialized sigma24 family protein